MMSALLSVQVSVVSTVEVRGMSDGIGNAVINAISDGIG
jgi:hypothetical protein